MIVRAIYPYRSEFVARAGVEHAWRARASRAGSLTHLRDFLRRGLVLDVGTPSPLARAAALASLQ